MKYIIILLALSFQIACSNDNKSDDSKKNQEATQTHPSEQDFQKGLEYYLDGDYKQALIWYAKAALQGHADAQNNLGIMYQLGQGVEQNLDQTLIWYTKAADQGHAKAQNNLGVMYQLGLGVEQDYKQAFEWFAKAADQGNTIAQRNLSKAYERGQGVEQNDNLARFWKQRSEEKR